MHLIGNIPLVQFGMFRVLFYFVESGHGSPFIPLLLCYLTQNTLTISRNAQFNGLIDPPKITIYLY